MPPKIAVIYYSATGHVHRLAEALAEGAEEAGAEVRLRRAAELAPPEAIAANEDWQRHVDEVAARVEEATLDDLEWADGIAFGSPTRFGLPAAQLKQFMDTTGPLWARGALADKAATSFTSAMNLHGGQESTLLALNNAFYHWGCALVPPGYTDERLYAAGGNPYGTSFAAGGGEGVPDEAALEAARIQGRRLAEYARLIAPLRDGAGAPADQAAAHQEA
jgi:NAD(P)H dehydrogenase (quinone)